MGMTRWPARFLYRLRQFVQGVTARVSAEEIDAATRVLPEAARLFFDRLPVDAQRHSLNVLGTLQAAGLYSSDLAAAALLHDVGKLAADQAGVGIGLWARGPMVVAEALAPRWLCRVAEADPAHGWRYAVHVQLAHPAIGAGWAHEWGCSELTCWLIAHHQDADTAEVDVNRAALLAALQRADGVQ